MNHPFFFFLPVIIYIYIFESIYYSLKCLKVHVCNYCSYLEVRVQSMQVHGVRALNDNLHVALEKGSYELDSTWSRTFYSCSFLFWLSVWINWFSLNKNSNEKIWNLIISEQSGKTHMSWDFFKLEIKTYRPTHVGNLRKKIFYLNNARKQTTEMSIHLIKTSKDCNNSLCISLYTWFLFVFYFYNPF